MGLFTTAKPVITKDEYNKVRNELSGQGFTTKELALVDRIVEPHLKDTTAYNPTPGIDTQEVKEIEEHLAKPDLHNVYSVDLPKHKQEILEEAFKKYLKK